MIRLERAGAEDLEPLLPFKEPVLRQFMKIQDEYDPYRRT